MSHKSLEQDQGNLPYLTVANYSSGIGGEEFESESIGHGDTDRKNGFRNPARLYFRGISAKGERCSEWLFRVRGIKLGLYLVLSTMMLRSRAASRMPASNKDCELTISLLAEMFMRPVRVVVPFVMLLIGVQVGMAAVVDSVDDFQDGTVQGWSHGPRSPNPPSNISSGGIGGVNDSYLELFGNGSDDAGGRIVAFNQESKWTGNYIAAGIHTITADVNNFGTTTLNLRLGIGAGTANGKWVTSAIALGPGSGWTAVSWSLLPGDLLPLPGSSDPTVDLMNVGELRIIDNSFVSYAAAVTMTEATLGVDNIVAVSAVPEPAALPLLAFSAAGFVALRRRWRMFRKAQ